MAIPKVEENIQLAPLPEAMIVDLTRILNLDAVTINQIIDTLVSQLTPLIGLIGSLSKNLLTTSGPAPFTKLNGVEEVVTTITVNAPAGSTNILYGGCDGNSAATTTRNVRKGLTV